MKYLIVSLCKPRFFLHFFKDSTGLTISMKYYDQRFGLVLRNAGHVIFFKNGPCLTLVLYNLNKNKNSLLAFASLGFFYIFFKGDYQSDYQMPDMSNFLKTSRVEPLTEVK